MQMRKTKLLEGEKGMAFKPASGVGRSSPRIIAAAVCACVATGCATDPRTGQPSFKETFASDNPCNNNARNIGIAVGTLAGVIIGNQIDHSNKSRVIGAAAGAALGGLIGADIDKRQCELYKIAQSNNLDLRSAPITASQIGMQNEAGKDQALGLAVALTDNGHQFRSGSDELTPEARTYFGQIADQYSYDAQKKRLAPNAAKDDIAAVEALKGKRILLTGHTDDTGSSALNADLSERRARAVARLFQSHGISDEQLFFQGAGETLPIADNHTEDGRAKNRRVEIVDLTDDNAFRAYLASRRPTLNYYRTAENAAISESKTTQVSAGKALAQAKHKTVKAAKAPVPPATDASIAANTRSTPASNAAATNVSAQSNAPTAKAGANALDFGGTPVAGGKGDVDIGNLETSRPDFSLISSAQADEPFIGACWRDRPRISRSVKSLKTGKDYATSDYMPGLYSTSWTDTVNGNLVALTGVAVLRDGGLPAAKPTLLVYQNYDPAKSATATPALKEVPDVNVYRGEKAVLYRVFGSGAVRCMDVVIPYGNSTSAPNSRLYYARAQATYVTNFNPKIAR